MLKYSKLFVQVIIDLSQHFNVGATSGFGRIIVKYFA